MTLKNDLENVNTQKCVFLLWEFFFLVWISERTKDSSSSDDDDDDDVKLSLLEEK